MILCCGEALIDMIPAPTVGGPAGFVPHSGGAVFNTAIALGRLGAPVGLLTGLSTDLFGAQLEADLAASHVGTGHLIQSDRPSTLAFVQLREGQASYAFFDENSAGRMISKADLPPIGREVDAMFFGGISLASPPSADAFAALAAQESAARLIMLDPNIRPGFIQDPAAYRARLSGMLDAADIVKVSDEDLHWISGGTESLEEKARALTASHGCSLLVTFGGDGASAFLPGGARLHVASRNVEVVDTVGAGDTFNAGVLASLAGQGYLSKSALKSAPPEAMEAALEFAAKVAAVTVSRAGANPPWKAELPA